MWRGVWRNRQQVAFGGGFVIGIKRHQAAANTVSRRIWFVQAVIVDVAVRIRHCFGGNAANTIFQHLASAKIACGDLDNILTRCQILKEIIAIRIRSGRLNPCASAVKKIDRYAGDSRLSSILDAILSNSAHATAVIQPNAVAQVDQGDKSEIQTQIAIVIIHAAMP